MTKLHVALVVAAAFVAAPLAMAHVAVGTPDRFCTGPTKLHDYGAPATGHLAGNPQDGNLQDCRYTPLVSEFGLCVPEFLPVNPFPELCDFCRDPWFGICDLLALDREADWDREPEYAPGGGIFAAVEPASIDCWDIPAHHGTGSSITVWADDVVFRADVSVTVTSDWARVDDPTQPECGDNVTEVCDPTDPSEVPGVTCNPLDQSVSGTGAGVAAGFGPGQDGTYHVLVGPGTLGSSHGHIWSD